MLATFPLCNFLLEFTEILSQNLICFHLLSLSGISKTMHYGILINMPEYNWSVFVLELKFDCLFVFAGCSTTLSTCSSVYETICLPHEWVCNGRDECHTGIDESDCVGKSSNRHIISWWSHWYPEAKMTQRSLPKIHRQWHQNHDIHSLA